MRAAIIGLPLSGKTTLFRALTGHKPAVADPGQEHLAVVSVPDVRLDYITRVANSKKTTPAQVEFVDFPGMSLADPHGQQDFKRHLPAIRLCDLLVLVVRDYTGGDVPAYRDRVDPAADLSEMHEELIFADLLAVSNRVERLEKALAKPSKTHDQEKRELVLLEACREALEASRPLSTVLTNPDDAHLVASFAFLTEKPAVAVYNVGEDRAAGADCKPPAHFQAAFAASAEIEAQLAELDGADQAAFMADLGITKPLRERLIQSCLTAAGYITFLTMGPTEARAWLLARGSTAVEAAGKIHTDLARGFIRAETVALADLQAMGDLKAAKAAGRVRQEGKSYVVQDGDILLIKFNV